MRRWKVFLGIGVAIAAWGGSVPLAALSTPALQAQAESVAADPSPALAALNLTAEQEAQMEHIRELARAQMQDVLTDEQWQLLQAQTNGEQISMAALNLSRSQQSQISEIEALVNQRFIALLTPEQLETLQELLQNQQP